MSALIKTDPRVRPARSWVLTPLPFGCAPRSTPGSPVPRTNHRRSPHVGRGAQYVRPNQDRSVWASVPSLRAGVARVPAHAV